MAAIKKLIKFDADGDQCIYVNNDGASGDVWLVINNKSVNFTFTASIDTTFEPAEYDDGYLVYDEQWFVNDAEIDSLTYDTSCTLSDDDRQQVHKLIIDAIVNADDDLDLKQARFDDAYAAQG